MKEFVFESELRLPRPRPEIFSYFADAHNLQAITPSWLKFEILTPAPIVLRKGTLIDYRIRLHGLPLRWRTEIAEWDPPRRFVDVQLSGPYKLWHHTHSFEETAEGTLCRDRVRYRARGGPLVHWLFVRRDLARIFAYREGRLRALFGSGHG